MPVFEKPLRDIMKKTYGQVAARFCGSGDSTHVAGKTRPSPTKRRACLKKLALSRASFF